MGTRANYIGLSFKKDWKLFMIKGFLVPASPRRPPPPPIPVWDSTG